jgi:hypothetical protein
MAERGMTVHGLREVVRGMERLGVDVQDLKTAFQKIGTKAEAQAKMNAPKVSGRLADTVRQSKRKNAVILMAGYNSKRLPYAAVHEYGWDVRGIPAKRYMRRTVDQLGGYAVKELEDELRALLRKRGF